MTANQIAYWSNQETKRSNLAKETETNRHNLATELETRRNNLVTEGIAQGKLNEDIRHNKAYERETNRHNLQTEALGFGTLAEQRRHNLSSEDISRQNVLLGYEQLDESKRHNVATETLGQANLAESIRANKRQEALTLNRDINQGLYNQSRSQIDRANVLNNFLRTGIQGYQTIQNQFNSVGKVLLGGLF